MSDDDILPDEQVYRLAAEEGRLTEEIRKLTDQRDRIAARLVRSGESRLAKLLRERNDDGNTSD